MNRHAVASLCAIGLCSLLTMGAAWAAEEAATEEGAPGTKPPPAEFAGMPLVFHDDFEDGRANWVATDENAWELTEDDGDTVFSLVRGSQYEPPYRSPLNIARVRDVVVTDFVLDAEMKQTGKDYGHRDMCIFFGYQDPAHFYYVHIATKADSSANSIFIVDAAERTSIASERTDGTDWGRDEYHKVRVTRNIESGDIAVYYDDMDKPIMKACDKTFLWGTVGFGSFDDTGNIDNVCLWGKLREGTNSEGN